MKKESRTKKFNEAIKKANKRYGAMFKNLQLNDRGNYDGEDIIKILEKIAKKARKKRNVST